jgi:hypothetical protein
MDKKLILSFFINYRKEKLYVFIKSLKENITDCNVAIVMNKETQEECKELIEKHNILVIDFNEHVENIIHLFNIRHKYYYKFIANNDYNSIIICDSSDVVFQSNPFLKLNGHLYLFNETISVGDENINTRWIKDRFGDDGFFELKGKPIINGGCYFGNKFEILNLEKKLIKLLNKGGVDQAILNHIAKDTDYIYTENGEIVANLALLISNGLNVDIKEDGFYLKENKPAIIHQYNRSKILSDYFNNKYK